MKQVLIIEDEQSVVQNLTEALGKGFEVSHITDGTEALKKIKKILPDVVVLDFDLPGKKGDEILSELKQDEEARHIPVLILTNMSDQVSVSKILAAGGRDYLVKADWRLDQVVEKIKEMVG